MSFQPLVGQGGYAGWRLLARTGAAQKALIARDPQVARETAHVRERLGGIGTAEDLVSDFRLLRTTLSAFGLETDVGNRFFIRKVLESDPSDPKSLVNRLSDRRYRTLAEAFSFSTATGPPSRLTDDIVERHVSAEFERRVGTIDGNLRLALSAERELKALGASGASDNTRWYTILGSVPLRKVAEGALGLGTGFGKLPLDRQLSEIKARSERLFGSPSPSVFAEPANVEKLIQRFLVRAQTVSPAQSSYNAALVLLSNRGR